MSKETRRKTYEEGVQECLDEVQTYLDSIPHDPKKDVGCLMYSDVTLHIYGLKLSLYRYIAEVVS